MGNCQKDQSQGQPKQINLNGPVCQLKIMNFIWQSAYQGLFDYQSKKIIQNNFIIKENSLLQKVKNQIKIIQDKQNGPDQKSLENSLFHVVKKQNYYKIFPIYIEVQQYTLQKLLWLIIRTLPDQKYKISERDIVKFGKQKVKIKQLVPATIVNNSAIIDFNHISVSKEIYDELNDRKPRNTETVLKKQLETSQNEIQSILTANQASCRICLEPGLKSDPLIAPCKCTGSIRYIHLKCLRMWLGKRLNISKSKCCITLNWQKLTCEMCHQTYRYRIYLDNKKFYTVQIPKPQKPYLVLQVMKKTTDKSVGKTYHFVSLSQKNTLTVGRKKDVDVRMSEDISISRHHATIMYDYNKHEFYLEDNKSKFGTLVLVKRNIIIKPNMKGIGFQLGTQVYRFQAIRSAVVSSEDKKVQQSLQPHQFLNIQQSQDDDQIDQNDDNSDSEGKFQENQIQNQHQNAQLVLNHDQSPQILRRQSQLVQHQ